MQQFQFSPARTLHREADDHVSAGRLDEALRCFKAALQHDPLSPPLRFNVANVLRELKRYKEALEWFDKAIEVKPDFAMAYHNKATTLLQLGRLEEGFAAYEWRKVAPQWAEDPRYKLPRPWRGEDLAGKTLFIFNELFQGDLIQFGRYAVLAEQAGARVILSAPTNMHALLQTMSPTIELTPEGDAAPDYDFHAPLMTLPLLFNTTLATIPSFPHYLRADPVRLDTWRNRIGEGGFKVGIAWQGSVRANLRSFPLALAAHRLAQVPSARLISLQKHAGLEQLEELPQGLVETLGDDFDPGPDAFVDTAAALMCCDLFITLDTSVAHLAGALGVPTWLALPFVPDWRWLEVRSDSPWYPSVRIFRQRSRGDWAPVFDEMAKALRKRAR